MLRFSRSTLTLAVCLVAAACGTPSGPDRVGTFSLETVAGRALPVPVETLSGHVSLLADTLRLDSGSRYRRTSIVLREDAQVGEPSQTAIESVGAVVREGASRVLVPDECRPDRPDLSLCVPPDTLTDAGTGIALRTSMLPGALLLYSPVH